MKEDTIIQFLERYSLFEGLSAGEIRFLASHMQFQVKKRFSLIYGQGESARTMYFLVKGSVKLVNRVEEGKELIKEVLSPVTFFGEDMILGVNRRREQAQAMKEEVHLLALDAQIMQRVLQTKPMLSVALLQHQALRLQNAENQLSSLVFKDARTRIVDFIRDTTRDQGRQVGFEMLLKHSLTHQDIANITHTSRQTVTLVLNELRKNGLIHFNRGRILVRDMDRLA